MELKTFNENIKLRDKPSYLFIMDISDGTANVCNTYTTFTWRECDISHWFWCRQHTRHGTFY